MAIERLTTEKERKNIRESKKYKGKIFSDLSNTEKDDLLKILAEKARLL